MMKTSPLKSSLAAAEELLFDLPPSPPSRTKVLRSAALLAHKQPLHLGGFLKPLIGAHPAWPAGAWVMGAAAQLARRAAVPPPMRWLEKLAAAFALPGTTALVPPAGFAGLPAGVWSEPALLGEVLQAAREAPAVPRRQGRAGRVSVGSVYTPCAVARPIVAEVHVGPRRLVDPACGAGVFLLEAFERAFRRRMEGGAPPKEAAAAALSYELTGIDMDAQALAVAEFSLRFTAWRHCGLEEDVPLDLRLQDALLPLPDLEGQCECVVGNPPFIEGRGLSATQLAGLRQRFCCAAGGKVNLFAVFVERGLELLKEGGVLAYVLPATFLRNARYRGLREVLMRHTLEAIRPLQAGKFGGRVVETVVLRVRKHPPLQNARVQLAGGPVLQSHLTLGPALRFCEHLRRGLRRQIELMERHGVPLGECFDVRDGISTGFQPFPQRLIGRVEDSRFIAGDGTILPFDPRVHKRVIDGG
ncbi:MAG: N-6 DNA methylase, partial [Planctomycetota bacterium]